MIGGVAHGPERATTVCQLTMRHFKEGDELVLEPWRSRSFPFVKDLVVDRRSFDRIIQAGGYVSVSTGNAPDGNAIPVGKEDADRAMDAAQCIGCGACVAACPNGSAALFTGAKIAHLGILPQGKPEQDRRAVRMVAQMNAEGFGSCTNIGEGDIARGDRCDESRLSVGGVEGAGAGRDHGCSCYRVGAGEVGRQKGFAKPLPCSSTATASGPCSIAWR
jgi:ferredoxin